MNYYYELLNVNLAPRSPAFHTLHPVNCLWLATGLVEIFLPDFGDTIRQFLAPMLGNAAKLNRRVFVILIGRLFSSAYLINASAIAHLKTSPNVAARQRE